jgi:hypothetical protein
MNPRDPLLQAHENDELLLSQVKLELDRSCAALDGHTVSRLNAMRHAVLEQKLRKRKPLLMPFGGLVTACVLVLAFTIFPRSGLVPENATATNSTATNAALEDIEILTSEENLEFYEDYEFYQWLAANESSI